MSRRFEVTFEKFVSRSRNYTQDVEEKFYSFEEALERLKFLYSKPEKYRGISLSEIPDFSYVQRAGEALSSWFSEQEKGSN